MRTNERLPQHTELISKRDLLEAQEPLYLKRLKAELLSKISDYESDVHLINDVLSGTGADDDEEEYTEYGHEVNIVRGDN